MAADDVAARERELEAIAAFFDALDAGPRALSIEGEPGIGKTTLWESAVATAAERSLHVLSCRPAAAEGGLTFAALGDLLADVDTELYAHLPEPQRRALAAALLLEAPDDDDRPVDQRAVAVGVLGVLRALEPVVVAIDDAQWIDGSSAAVLSFAWRRLRSERAALVLAIRAGESSPVAVDDVVVVGPLTVGAIHRVIRARLGVSLPRPTLVRVHTASRGNPFYALELARFLGAGGERVAPGTPLPLTERLADVAELRLAALPRDDDVLLAVALGGESVDVVARALGAGARIDDAVAAGVLERDGRTVRFTHPLLAEAVHARSSVDDRRRVHRLLADAVDDGEQRARHLALAASGPDRDAARALDAEAERAAARGAPLSAAELAELAVALTPPDDRDAVAARTITAADRHTSAGGLGRAQDLLRELLPSLDRGARRAGVLLRLGRLDGDMEVLVARSEEALADARGDETRLAIAHAQIASAWTVRGGIGHALEHGARAVAHARKSGDRSLTAAALSRLAVWETWAGRPAEARIDESVAVGAPVPRTEIFGNPHIVRGLLRLYQGRLDEARELLEQALAAAEERGDELDFGDLQGRLAELECRAGRFPAAERHAAASYELAEQVGFRQFGAWTCFRRALVDAHLGRVEEARATAERGLELATAANHDTIRHFNDGVLGFLDLGLGRPEAAAERLRPLLRWLAGFGLAMTPFPVSTYALEALVETRDAEADALVAQLEREGQRLGSPLAVATAQRLRGLLDADAGRFDGAVAQLELALAAAADHSWPFERARTLLALGDVRRRAKEKAAARTTLEQSVAAFDDLGATLWAARARASLGRISGRTAAPADELTPTERRVAELVAEGRTNKEVAAALFVALRTVEWNLSKVYVKLGVRSRTELAHRLSGEHAPDLRA